MSISIVQTIRLKSVFIAYISTFFMMIGCQNESSKDSQAVTSVSDSAHPNLILTQESVVHIKEDLGKIPLFDHSLASAKEQVDTAIVKGIDVPIPKDMAGGYTHTQHKYNYDILQKAGVLFQITGDEKYAIYTRDVLLAYAKMYPTLPRHPQERSYARGKIFWQCLNDANWLVYMSQAYDCIRGWISEEEREVLDNELFRPFADFLSVETPQFFNRIHNHSTWGNVGVGMIGLVMDDQELVDRALYGIKNDSITTDAMDNDGGLIKTAGQKSGFLANLDEPFSPDGYYTEGPYYQRYAMYPFLAFAQALEAKKPELNIFEYKDGLLIKAIDALLNLTDADGEFFPLNDGQKGMSYQTASLVSAVDIAYFYGTQDPRLLSVAQQQGQVQLDATGLAVAKAIEEGKATPFVKKSVLLSDGARGDEGGIAILRSNTDAGTMALVMKNASHGLSHGHFDKLSYSLYEDGEEVLQDYGLARFVNIEQKNGGGYLKENTTWAKQTIAHNTLVQDETSHFKGVFKESSKYHPEITAFSTDHEASQMVAAVETNAYSGTSLKRALVMISSDQNEKPYIIDVFKVTSDQAHQYDLPFYYQGQIISTSFDLNVASQLSPLGTSAGYQHIWKEATGTPAGTSNQFTWLNHRKFYSITSLTHDGDSFILGRVGANDPEFNLRRDPMFIHRKKNTKEALFVSVIESHGRYNPVTEKATNAYSVFERIQQVDVSAGYIVLEMIKRSGEKQLFMMSETAFANLPRRQAGAENESQTTVEHTVNLLGITYTWKGNYTIQHIK